MLGVASKRRAAQFARWLESRHDQVVAEHPTLEPYLSTLVPGFTNPLMYAVVAGAVTEGGLTVNRFLSGWQVEGQMVAPRRCWRVSENTLGLRRVRATSDRPFSAMVSIACHSPPD